MKLRVYPSKSLKIVPLIRLFTLGRTSGGGKSFREGLRAGQPTGILDLALPRVHCS